MSGTQVGLHRTSDRTIQFFVQQQLLRQGHGPPVGVDALGGSRGNEQLPRQLLAVDRRGDLARARAPRRGLRAADLDQQHQPACRASWSTTTARSSSASARGCASGRRSTWSPRRRRASATRPTSRTSASRSRSGPAATRFQLNFSNGFGTTLAQVARGGRQQRQLVSSASTSRANSSSAPMARVHRTVPWRAGNRSARSPSCGGESALRPAATTVISASTGSPARAAPRSRSPRAA